MTGPQYLEEGRPPANDLSLAEAAKVALFGLDREPRPIVEDIPSGFVILAGMAAFLLVVAAVIVVLIAYGVTHRS